MAQKRCPACGRTFLRGTRALLFGADSWRGAIVCGKCAGGGLLVVPIKLAPTEVKRVVASEGVERSLKKLLGYRKLWALNRELDAKVEGLDVAIDVLTKETRS
jgi:hypothetical protein